MSLQYTPLEAIETIHKELHTGFTDGKLKSLAYRKYVVLQLGYLLKDNATRFHEALASDLGRPIQESQFMEVGPSISDARVAYQQLEKWAKPETPPFSINSAPMRPVIYKEPKGVILIISPFNYPVWLTFGPMISAIAAGNTVALKPSEQTPATSALMAELIPKYVDSSLIQVINGGPAETTKLMELPWGHVLYTGGGRVGRIIAGAAAKTLTPVSLELGGKSPVFIDSNCDLETAARRIMWGKIANAGQTCVAPDYVMVQKDFQDTFVQALKTAHDSFYPDSVSAPGNYSRLVSPQAFTRVSGLLKETKGSIVFGGETDEATKYIAPTIVKDVTFEDSLMSDEIFGPLLPIVPVGSLDEAIKHVNSNDHPLSLYVFSKSQDYIRKVFTSTQSGSAIANESIIHPGLDGLPFGGIGPSGNGSHTGKHGFDLFTHLRSSINNPSWVDKIIGFRYPPYSDAKFKKAKLMQPSLPSRPSGPPRPETSRSFSKWWFFALASAVVALLTKKLNLKKAVPQLK
ncbi:NAD-aldehyde dehydrogenase [Mycena floridula]|nr:NAD-aldehyde dehydrogenase [Mycena floridula]